MRLDRVAFHPVSHFEHPCQPELGMDEASHAIITSRALTQVRRTGEYPRVVKRAWRGSSFNEARPTSPFPVS